MAGRLPAAWVDEVYVRADIVQVVSSYLPLKKKGRNHWGLCPFHSEKTPSFSVNPELNVYYCFGCKAGGNVVQFVMEMERLTYPEALLHLARQLRLQPPDLSEEPGKEKERSLQERLHEANREAARYYHHLLWSEKGAEALSYLKRRGLDDTMIRRFGLGASGDGWDGLCGHLLAKGFSEEELRLAGLVQVREKNRYDVFRGRVMFPIIDLYGRTVGFGARALGTAQPKYLNTSDTPVFNKRMTVYGINLLKKQRDLRRIILVEGYMDVLALDQSSVPGAVATLGTSLTGEQARLMKRFAPEVWISYDGDEPGQQATLRAIEVFERESFPVRVIGYPDGLDPDEFIRKHGAGAFLDLKPVSAFAFRLRRLEKAYDLSAQEGRTGFAREAARLLAGLREPVEMELSLKTLSVKTGFSIETLKEQVASGRRQQIPPVPEPARRTPALKRKPDAAPENQAENTLLSLLASGYLPAGMVSEDDFVTMERKALARRLIGGERPAAILAECGEGPERAAVVAVFAGQTDLDRDQAAAAAEECLRTLKIGRLMGQIAKQRAEMEKMDAQQKGKSLEDIMALSAEIKRLRGMAANGKDVV